MKRAYVLLVIIVTFLAAALAVILFLALLPLLKVITEIIVGVVALGGVYFIALGVIDVRRRWHHSIVMPVGEHGVVDISTWRHLPSHTVDALPSPRAQAASRDESSPPTVVEVPTFAELLESNAIRAGAKLLLGYVDGDPRQGTWLDLYSCAVAGLQGSGKTTTELFIILQSVLHGARLLIIDPHRDVAKDSLGGRLAPLSSCFLRPVAADDEKDILATIKLARREVARRLKGATGFPLILVVDEFTRLMRRSPDIKDELAACIEEIAQEGRKMGVFALLSGQIWKATAVGGNELRYSLASSFVHRIQEQQAKLLLPSEFAKLTPKLKPGQVYFYDTNGETEFMSIPYTTEQDVLVVARMLQTSPPDFRPTSYQTSNQLQEMPMEATTTPSLKLVPKAYEATNEEGAPLLSPELERKYASVVELMAQEKKQGDIIAAVWGVTSGGGAAYQKAAEELRSIQRVIAEIALTRREA